MRQNRQNLYGPSKTRIVHYEVHGPWREDPEPLLKRAVKAGVITQYDDGRGAFCWFEGPPGKSMRELLASVIALSNHDSLIDCYLCKLRKG